jgi:DNA polymerase-1
MAADIKSGIDIHKQTASDYFKKKIEDVTKDERQKAKNSTFGIMYGRGAKSLAEEHGMTEEEAESMRKEFFNKYPKAKDWIFNTQKVAQKYGEIKNAFGRIRRLPAAQIPWSDNMEGHDRKERSDALRQAINSPIQSMAADITAITGIRIHKHLKQIKSKVKLVLTIHDSLIYEVPIEEKENFIKIIKEEVARGYDTINGPIRVKMGVDISVGDKWGKLVKLEE